MTGAVLVVAAALVGVVTLAAAFGLRRLASRLGSLRTQILVIAFVSMAIAATAAVAMARLMVFDSSTLRGVLAVLALIVPFVAALVIISTEPLRGDVGTIEAAVRRIERGERSVPLELSRSDELGAVAAAIEELAQQLEQVEARRSAVEAERRLLISSISHDLRSPLGAIRAAVEALADGVAPDPDRYLRTIAADVETLGRLVDDLFLLSRLQAGNLAIRRETVDLAELADETIEALAPLAAQAGVELALRADHPVPAVVNPSSMGRVLRNLVDNAIRHAPTATTVTLSAALLPPNPAMGEPGGPTITVADEGPGFPAEFAPHAFDRFARADTSRNRSSGGAGLGLAIAKGVVDAHGGSIGIGPGPHGTVWVQLPDGTG